MAFVGLSLLLVTLTGLSLGDSIFDRSVCYGDLGCFKTADFRSLVRPIVLLPADPAVIDTKFFLYTRQNPTAATEELLTYTDPSSVTSSYFNSSLPTKIIIHGFNNNGHEQWVMDMVTALLKEGDYNVISVDWRNGAKPLYTQATANTQVVGRQIPKLVKLLLKNPSDEATSFHLIGHDMGAHIAGYAGADIFRLARISALDPAAPYFEGGQEASRLDRRDAEFVDVIHSDGSGFVSSLGMGFETAIGDVDFYPNGGAAQPGCDHSNKLSNSLTTFITKGYTVAGTQFACSHLRSIDLFTESISSECPFMAYACKDNATFGTGNCLDCSGADSCARMGFHADQEKAKGSFYLFTSSSAPYCNNHYLVRAQAGKLGGSVRGTLTVQVNGTKDDLSNINLINLGTISDGQVNSKLIGTRKDIGKIVEATVSYSKSASFFDSFLYSDFYKLNALDIFMAERQEKSVFCGNDISIDGSQFRSFIPSTTSTC